MAFVLKVSFLSAAGQHFETGHCNLGMELHGSAEGYAPAPSWETEEISFGSSA